MFGAWEKPDGNGERQHPHAPAFYGSITPLRILDGFRFSGQSAGIDRDSFYLSPRIYVDMRKYPHAEEGRYKESRTKAP